MTFGLSVLNDSGIVSIDSEYSRLCVMQSGLYSGNSGLASIAFNSPITTAEPPLVFLSPTNNGSIVTVGCRVLGSPGNWTGVNIGGQANASLNGKYFIGAFAASPVAQFGMRLWDGSSKLLYDSATPTANFTRFYQNWTYTKTTRDDQGYYINWYSSPLGPTDEYLLINNAGMRMLSGDNIGRGTGIVFDFSSSQLWFTTTALSNPFSFSLPAVFAKLAV